MAVFHIGNLDADTVLLLPKDPGTFCGTVYMDIHDLISWYDCVGKQNRLDNTLMLAHVVFLS